MAETALVALVSEAEPHVSRWRTAFTQDGALNMPAHVTLLYPFADSTGVSERLQEVEAVFRRFLPFPGRLVSVERWEDDPPVLYLAPEPAQPFAELTAALTAAFPEHPPYGGVHEEVIPHLTVAESVDADTDEISEELRAVLPIAFRVEEAALMELAPSRGWQLRSRFPLGD